MEKAFIITPRKRLTGLLVAVAVFLCIPLIAMLFTNAVNWTLIDFVVAAVLLSGTVLLIELVLRKVKKTSHRIAIVVTILALLILVWIELAVGIFGTAISGT